MSAQLRQLTSAIGLYRFARWVQLRTVQRKSLQAQRRHRDFFASLVKPGELTFDVGANRGDVTDALLAAGARVVAFEPQPDMCHTIRSRMGTRPDLHIRECVLGAAPGDATLFVNERHTGGSSLLRDWPDQVSRSIVVPMSTLDAEIAKHGRPSYIKIDVEGYEVEVLKGLSTHVPLVSFEHTRDKPDGYENVRSCMDLLGALGRSVEVNITPAENFTFAATAWMPASQFMRKYPDDFRSVEYSFGDIFVRSVPAA